MIGWTADEAGRVTSCTVTRSSGHEALDHAACRAIIERACYDPATLHGKLAFTRRVVWRLPKE